MAINIKKLKKYFRNREDVLMAFIFGSWAKGREIAESDFDVAVYFRGKSRGIESNEETLEERESEIWSDVLEIVKKSVDLICLNNAPASLVSEVIKTGIPLVVKDEKLYWNLYLEKSLEVEDFLHFAQDYFRIYKQAKSLSSEQKSSLLERIQFLDSELKEIQYFKKLSFEDYQTNKIQRRNIERWTENIINATIDIGKIILASEKKRMPKSYEESLINFGIVAGLKEKEAKKFSRFANLRNILAHEYLDILYGRIQTFIKESPPLYKKIFGFLETYLR